MDHDIYDEIRCGYSEGRLMASGDGWWSAKRRPSRGPT